MATRLVFLFQHHLALFWLLASPPPAEGTPGFQTSDALHVVGRMMGSNLDAGTAATATASRLQREYACVSHADAGYRLADLTPLNQRSQTEIAKASLLETLTLNADGGAELATFTTKTKNFFGKKQGGNSLGATRESSFLAGARRTAPDASRGGVTDCE